jgi:hypothetical protein
MKIGAESAFVMAVSLTGRGKLMDVMGVSGNDGVDLEELQRKFDGDLKFFVWASS